MERAPDGRILVACDTCILINFMQAERLDLLGRHKEYRIVITEHVRAEVTDARQEAALVSAISAGEIEEATLTDPPEVAFFAALRTFLGRGEAAAIAVAANRGWAVATDETGKTLREIESRIGKGRLLTTPGLLLKCILNGTLTVAEADALKAKLASRRFVMKFRSFADLLPKPP